MFLRGHDGFAMWCMPDETVEEVRAVHEVFRELAPLRAFAERGVPVFFDVPPEPGPVVSGLLLDDEVLVRRTDFGVKSRDPVQARVAGRKVTIPRADGEWQRIRLPE